MRVIAFLILCLFSTNVYSQFNAERFLDSTVADLKAQSNIDKNDLQMFSLLENFYSEALQSEKGELSPKTAQKINSYLTDTKTKNRHLLILFLMYQEHISEEKEQAAQKRADDQLAATLQIAKAAGRVT